MVLETRLPMLATRPQLLVGTPEFDAKIEKTNHSISGNCTATVDDGFNLQISGKKLFVPAR